MNLVKNLRYNYIDDDGHGPTVNDGITFLRGCPELCRKGKTLKMFRLSCLCIGHFPPLLRDAKFDSAVSFSSGPELSENIEPVQSYLLSGKAQSDIFTDTNSILECVELFDVFAGYAPLWGYDAWANVDFCNREPILMKLFSNHKINRSAKGSDEGFLNIPSFSNCRHYVCRIQCRVNRRKLMPEKFVLCCGDT